MIKEILDAWYKWDINNLNEIRDYVNNNCKSIEDKMICFNILKTWPGSWWSWLSEIWCYIFCLYHLLCKKPIYA